VLIRVEDGAPRITSLDRRIRRIQALVREHNRAGAVLSESLIADRRAETAEG
jgi:hypothetical protein